MGWPSPTLIWLLCQCLLLALTLHITPVKLLHSSMENTVIQHAFLKFHQSKKYRFSIKTPDKTEKKTDLVEKPSSGNWVSYVHNPQQHSR